MNKEILDRLDDLTRFFRQPTAEPIAAGNSISQTFAGSPALLMVIQGMIATLEAQKGPGNFLAATLEGVESGKRYSLTIQKEGSKTPAERIAELEKLAADTMTDLAGVILTLSNPKMDGSQYGKALKTLKETARRLLEGTGGNK